VSAFLSPPPVFRSWDNLGFPLINGKLFTYAAGTTTPQATYPDSTQVTPNPNPIPLNFRGECFLWLDATLSYKFVLQDAAGNLIWTEDNIPGSPFASSGNLVPTVTNTFTLGTPSRTWANAYLGPNAAPVFDPISGNIGYYARTAAEIAAGVTPTNFAYAPGDIRRYGALAGGSAATNVIAIQTALNVANNNGAEVFVPNGTFQLNAALTVPKNTVLYGNGWQSSILQFTHTGDGIDSSWTPNSTTAVYVSIRDLTITNNNPSNVGGGFVDVAGSYIKIRDCLFSGFKFGVIFDQTEVSSIRDCSFIVPGITNGAGIWLVNGADHVSGNLTLFTNRVTIDGNQINAAIGANYGIVDDGGTNHTISNNNINAPSFGMRLASVYGLILLNNESEVCSSVDIILDETNAGIGLIGSAYLGPVAGFQLTGNELISSGVSHNLRLSSARNGSVVGNVFGQAVGACITFFGGSSNPCSDIILEGNDKLVTGNGKTAAPFFSAATLGILRANKIRQVPQTYVSSALGSTGSQTITPQSMENINPGTRLMVRDPTGVATEQIIVTSTTTTTLTATFANIHAANFVLLGITGADEQESVFAPILSGSSTAGSNAYATDNAGLVQRRGNLVIYNFLCDAATIDVTMAGTLQISLPYVSENQSNQSAIAHIDLWTGFTLAAGFSQLGGIILPGSNIISLRRSGSGVAINPLLKTDISGTACTIGGSVTYFTSAP
jgi:hypothetical protein